MVEHDRRGQPLQKVRSLDDLLAQHMDLHVPAEIVDALRQGLEHVDCRRAGLDEIEAYAAYAEAVQPLEFGVCDARIDHRNAARARAELRHRVQGAGIVRAVSRWRDDNVARRADTLLEKAIVVDRRIGGPELGVRRDRKAAVINVHVRVAGVRRRLEFRRFRSRRPGHGLSLSCRRIQSARHDDRRSHGLEDASAGSMERSLRGAIGRRKTPVLPGGLWRRSNPEAEGRPIFWMASLLASRRWFRLITYKRWRAAHAPVLPAAAGPLDRRGQTTSVLSGCKITDAGVARRLHDPGHFGPHDRQQLRFEPRIALEPAVVPP